MTNENDSSYFHKLHGYEYEDEYCDRACVELLIYPGEKSPFEITRLLGIQPTEHVAIGEERRSITTGRVRIGKVNGWFLSSETFVQSTDMNRHIDWLTEELKKCFQAFKQLQKTDGVKMYVTCIWWVNVDGGGPILRPKQMRDLADLNLECAFDFQYYGIEGRIPGLINQLCEENGIGSD